MKSEICEKFKWSKIFYDTEKKNPLYYAYYIEVELGYIEYYKKWKKWVWNQGENIIISSSCIEEILKKLKKLEKTKK